VIDLEGRTVTSRAGRVNAGIRSGTRQQLLEGTWNATSVLLGAGDAIERTAERLPYLHGFRSSQGG